MKAHITTSGGIWWVGFRDSEELNDSYTVEINLICRDEIHATAVCGAFNQSPTFEADKIEAMNAINAAWNRLGCSPDYDQFVKDIATKAILP